MRDQIIFTMEEPGMEDFSCLDTDDGGSERELSPPKFKMKKLTGAATYRTKFNQDWKKEFSFVKSVRGDPYRLV